MAAGLVWQGQRLLVQRRAPAASFGAGLLELPGGKLEPGEPPRAALARELVEEWGPAAASLSIGGLAEVLHHVYPADDPADAGADPLEVVLIVYHVDAGPVALASLTAVAGAEILSLPAAALPVEEFLPADREFVRAVAQGRVRPGTAPR